MEPRALLRALVEYDGEGDVRAARERIVRSLAISNLDTASVLFALEEIRPPAQFRRALDALAWKSPTKRLDGLTAASVMAAQRAEPAVMPTLCAVAGFNWNRLDDWTDVALPTEGEERWSLKQVEAALEVIDARVEGTETTPLASAEPLRALELLSDVTGRSGWAAVEQMRTGGVPYEVLLAQREAGGAWLSHRNRTSNRVANVLADELCDRLEDAGVDFLRSRRLGGSVISSEIERLGGGSRSVGLVVRNGQRTPVAAVAFSVARDGGTARSSGSRLLKLRDASLPVLLLLAGPGWADRNETADLAEAFDGEIYTDEHLDELANELARRAGEAG